MPTINHTPNAVPIEQGADTSQPLVSEDKRDWLDKFSSQDYTTWMEETASTMRNNYPDFDFREDVVATYKKGDTPIDAHKLLHPAWYLASKTYAGPLDQVKTYLNKLRLYYQGTIGALFSTSAAEALHSHKVVLRTWLAEEAAKPIGDDFHRLLKTGFKLGTSIKTQPAPGSTARINVPVNYLNPNIFDSIDTILDKDHPFNSEKVGIASAVDVTMTQHQLFNITLAYKLELYYATQAILARSLQAGSVSIEVNGNKIVNVVTSEATYDTVPNYKHLFSLISNLPYGDQLPGTGTTAAKLKALTASTGDKNILSAALGSVLRELHLEIVDMCSNGTIEAAMQPLGFLDIDAATLNESLDKQLAVMKNADWEDNFIKAFPTFRLFIIEEDTNQLRLFDDFYSYDAVQGITIVESKHAASSTALLKLSNVTGRLSTEGLEDFLYDSDNGTPLSSIQLRSGTKIMIRMGYGPDYRNLPVSFLGTITEVVPGPVLEIQAQSFGAELLHEFTTQYSNEGNEGSAIKPDAHDAIGQVVMTVLDQTPGLKHFGRWQLQQDQLDEKLVSGTTLSNAYKIANFAFLGGMLSQDFNLSAIETIGLSPSDQSGLFDAAAFINSWQKNTNAYAMLLNFGNDLYQNIYVNNKNPRLYGFLRFVSGQGVGKGGTFNWFIDNQSTWSALWELATHHGDYIVRPLIYNEGMSIFSANQVRNTLYFGPREGTYKALDTPYHLKSNDEISESFTELYRGFVDGERNELEDSTIFGGPTGSFGIGPLNMTTSESEAMTMIAKLTSASLQEAEMNTARDLNRHQNDIFAPWRAVGTGISETWDTLLGRQSELEYERDMLFEIMKRYAPALAAFGKEHLDAMQEADNQPTSGTLGTVENYVNRTPISNLNMYLHLVTGGQPGKYTQGERNSTNSVLDVEVAVIFGTQEAYLDQWYTALRQDIPLLVANSTSLGLDPNLAEHASLSYLKRLADESGDSNYQAYRPVVEHHLATSHTNIMQNEIIATAEPISNKVTVYYPETHEVDDIKRPPSEWPKDSEHRRSSVLSYEIDTNYIREYVSFQRNASQDIDVTYTNMKDSPNTKSALPIAQRLADTILLNQVKPMYQGNLVLTGNPSIKPWHVVHIVDMVNQMDGVIEVEQVVHNFDAHTGFTTTVTPNLYCTLRNNKTMIDTQLMNYHAQASSFIRWTQSIIKGLWTAGNVAGAGLTAAGVYGAVTSGGAAAATAAATTGAATGVAGVGAAATGAAGAVFWPITIAAMAIGSVSFWDKYQTMQITQYVNSALMHRGNAPIVMAYLHYKNRPYLAGLEGVTSLNKDLATIVYDKLYDDPTNADIRMGVLGQTDTVGS
jgi:hypothetical protein